MQFFTQHWFHTEREIFTAAVIMWWGLAFIILTIDRLFTFGDYCLQKFVDKFMSIKHGHMIYHYGGESRNYYDELPDAPDMGYVLGDEKIELTIKEALIKLFLSPQTITIAIMFLFDIVMHFPELNRDKFTAAYVSVFMLTISCIMSAYCAVTTFRNLIDVINLHFSTLKLLGEQTEIHCNTLRHLDEQCATEIYKLSTVCGLLNRAGMSVVFSSDLKSIPDGPDEMVLLTNHVNKQTWLAPQELENKTNLSRTSRQYITELIRASKNEDVAITTENVVKHNKNAQAFDPPDSSILRNLSVDG